MEKSLKKENPPEKTLKFAGKNILKPAKNEEKKPVTKDEKHRLANEKRLEAQTRRQQEKELKIVKIPTEKSKLSNTRIKFSDSDSSDSNCDGNIPEFWEENGPEGKKEEKNVFGETVPQRNKRGKKDLGEKKSRVLSEEIATGKMTDEILPKKN